MLCAARNSTLAVITMNKVAITIIGVAKGRGLVASRRFRAGQVVFRETALVRSGDASTSVAFPLLAAAAAEESPNSK